MQTILIQEADQAIREILVITLQEEGYRVIALTELSSQDLPVIAQEKPSLVVLDFKITGEAAIKMCQLIKTHYPKLPVLALSCNNHIKERYKEHGFDGYIEKPFDIETLINLIKLFLSGSTFRNKSNKSAIQKERTSKLNTNNKPCSYS